MAKNSAIRKLAIIAGAGFVANEIYKGQTAGRSANIPDNAVNEETVAALLKNDDAFLSRVKGTPGRHGSGLSELLISSIPVPDDLTLLSSGMTVRSEDNTETYLVIKKPTEETTGLQDEEFFKLIHGPDYAGPIGEQGPIGPVGSIGERGLDGLNAPTWGQSLVINGHFENGAENWSNGVFDPVTNTFNISSSSGVAATSDNAKPFYFNAKRLLKIELSGETDSDTIRVLLRNLDRNQIPIFKDPSGSYTYRSFTGTGIFDYVTFWGGTGSSAISFASGVFSLRLSLEKTNGTFLKVEKIIVTQVPLGEPVPHNLSYLPSGQMVYHTVTGALGRYNGTSINWATMV